MLNLINVAGEFFSKHTILYVITLIFTVSFGGQVTYLNTNFVHAADFESFTYDYKLDRLQDEKYRLEDSILYLPCPSFPLYHENYPLRPSTKDCNDPICRWPIIPGDFSSYGKALIALNFISEVSQRH